MIALGRISGRFNDWLSNETTGRQFQGSIQSASEGIFAVSNFLETRLTLHTRPQEHVFPGNIIKDKLDRRFLVAVHDATPDVTVLKLFPVTSFLEWKRPTTEIEPVTGLEKSVSQVTLGQIWCAVELYGREEMDRATHIGMDRSRLLTGENILLNDMIDTRMVRRIHKVYGITLAEIQ